jgi:hypothetical protein
MHEIPIASSKYVGSLNRPKKDKISIPMEFVSKICFRVGVLLPGAVITRA